MKQQKQYQVDCVSQRRHEVNKTKNYYSKDKTGALKA